MQRGNHLLSCCVLAVWDSCRRAPTSNPDQLQMWCCCMRRLLRAACSADQNGGDCCGCAGGSPHHRDHACNLLDRYLLSALCRHAHLPNALVQQEISGATYTTKCWAYIYSIEWNFPTQKIASGISVTRSNASAVFKQLTPWIQMKLNFKSQFIIRRSYV